MFLNRWSYFTTMRNTDGEAYETDVTHVIKWKQIMIIKSELYSKDLVVDINALIYIKSLCQSIVEKIPISISPDLEGQHRRRCFLKTFRRHKLLWHLHFMAWNVFGISFQHASDSHPLLLVGLLQKNALHWIGPIAASSSGRLFAKYKYVLSCDLVGWRWLICPGIIWSMRTLSKWFVYNRYYTVPKEHEGKTYYWAGVYQSRWIFYMQQARYRLYTIYKYLLFIYAP